jgi:hydrogenase maturation protein HypF
MKLIFRGIVQGVGFRPTIYRIATSLGLKGYVINKGSEVEVVIDKDTDLFIKQVKQHLPAIAQISTIEKIPYDHTYTDFQIRHSKSGSRESLIPPDVATCTACQKELLEKRNRRNLFPFTNCTVCGARYSLIVNVPYDRERTAMSPFNLCSQCQQEYKNVNDRRYHAQTISCPRCGPKYTLYNDKKQKIQSENIIRKFGQEIENGSIGVIKSWGGMHLCCNLNEIQRFRNWYHRPQKAFALMIKDLKTARKYAVITPKEKDLLESNARPIVLVKNIKEKAIAPGLNSLGLFLPYTGLHHLLFDAINTDALVMTSANIPGEPMMLANEEVFSLHADWYLLHNREIPNRIDDSVIKTWRNNTFFLRKSRGYIPDPIDIPYDHQIISVGAGENITGAVSSLKRLYTTQYIGNGTYYKTLDFLEQSIEHLMNLLIKKPQIECIVRDKHPGYDTRLVAKRFAEKYNAKITEISHHWAHAAALLLDAEVKNAVVLTLDGLGFGDDGTYWGGDVLHSNFTEYARVGHLEYLPLIGGDRATKDPRRLVYAIFPHLDSDLDFSNKEISLLEKLVPKSPKCCSFGRYLDALACYLEICCNRTYSGEPAMKLEKYLTVGKNTMEIDIQRKGSIVPVLDIFHQMDSQISKPINEHKKADICYSVVKAISNELTDIAIEFAENQNISTIGITGGVSYNIPIMEMVFERVKKAGKRFIAPNRIPNGDGCISVGQNVLAGHQI